MKKGLSTMFLLLCINLMSFLSCSKENISDSGEKNDNNNGIESPVDPNDIDYSKVGVEYDDGTNVVFNVKIALDEHSLTQYPLEYWKKRLKKHWENVTLRFNRADKEGGVDLTRNYIFVPDLDNILICKNSQKSNDFGSYAIENKLFDKEKFQLIVTYDSYAQAVVGEVSGGCGNKEGISMITVINPGKDSQFFNHFEDKYTDGAVTHELGHFRGLIDLYNHPISAENNLISGDAFKPIEDIMNGYTYGDIDECFWNDYSLKIINVNKEKKIVDILNRTMFDYFADKLQIEVTDNGKPITDTYTINFYENERIEGKNSIPQKTPDFSFQQQEGKPFVIGTKYLFYNDHGTGEHINLRKDLFLVEIKHGAKKAYQFLANYEVHNQGLTDKAENKKKESTYIMNFDLK